MPTEPQTAKLQARIPVIMLRAMPLRPLLPRKRRIKRRSLRRRRRPQLPKLSLHQSSYPNYFQPTTTLRAKRLNIRMIIGIARPTKRSAIWITSMTTFSLITAKRLRRIARSANGHKGASGQARHSLRLPMVLRIVSAI